MQVLNTGTGHLQQKREEDWAIIQQIENRFKVKRGHVIKMPKAGSSVVACMSGGLDSTANIGMLLEKFKLEVYPFFIKRKQSNLPWELKSRDFFDAYFKKRWPSLYHPVLEIELETPGWSYKNMLRDTKNLKDDPELRRRNTYPARNPVMFLTGLEYAYSLQSKGVCPKSVFVAEQADDFSVHGSLTYLRQINDLWCWLTSDWSWQLISIPIEKEFDNYCGKEFYVKYGHEIGLPLEKTRSCCNKEEVQCGICPMACIDRRKAFLKAGVEDKTKYQHPLPEEVSKEFVK